ncbi:MAG: A24 family peptidase [Candidatus Tumulicola sp.]
MTLGIPATAAAALLTFGAIARNRSRAYGVEFSGRCAAAIVPAAIAMAFSVWLAVHGDRSIGKAVVLACTWACAATDLQSGYVFDWISLGGLTASLLLASKAHALVGAMAGCGLGGGVPLLVYAVTAGRGIGLGDVKLAAAIGAGLGVACTVEALRMAAVCAGIVAFALVITGRAQRRSALRFAPFLAVGASYGVLACE